MKLLQAIVALLTVLLFLARQEVLCGVCPVKKLPSCLYKVELSSSRFPRICHAASACFEEDVFMPVPKYKKDPKITVDNEDIDVYPME